MEERDQMQADAAEQGYNAACEQFECRIKELEQSLKEVKELSDIQLGAEKRWADKCEEKDKQLKAMRDKLNPQKLAKLFHVYYEKHAPIYNYKTRKESAVKWDNVPENNKKLMIKTCESVIGELLQKEGK